MFSQTAKYTTSHVFVLLFLPFARVTLSKFIFLIITVHFRTISSIVQYLTSCMDVDQMVIGEFCPYQCFLGWLPKILNFSTGISTSSKPETVSNDDITKNIFSTKPTVKLVSFSNLRKTVESPWTLPFCTIIVSRPKRIRVNDFTNFPMFINFSRAKNVDTLLNKF